MINIFNLFLTLFFFWIIIAYSNSTLSWFYVFFGMFSALIISFCAWKMKIINKYNHFLFLNFGFYRHFLIIIGSAFLPSLVIIFESLTNKTRNSFGFYQLPVKKLNNLELLLMMSTINLMPGTIFLGINDNQLKIFAINQKYFAKINLAAIYESLEKINDNRLV